MSFSGKSILLDQLGACLDNESWFVPLSIALDDLTPEQAASKEPSTINSIWQIVNHLNFWNQRWLQRFQETWIPGEPVDNNSTFDLSKHNITLTDWHEAVTKLNSVLSEWHRAISECSDSKLETSIDNYEFDAPWWAAISNLVTHNTYHIGQIVQIRKLHGTWNLKR